MIEHKPGRGWVVKSESGKELSKDTMTRKEALRRLAQIEWFKKHPEKKK